MADAPEHAGTTVPVGDYGTHVSWARAFADLREGFSSWYLWGALGWQEIQQRYRRSMLGPFWLTFSMALMVGGLGVLYSTIFKMPIEKYLPWLTLGILTWNFLTGLINDAGSTFTVSEHTIKQIRIPYSVYMLRTMWRNVIIVLHNAVVYIAVAVIFSIAPTWYTLLVLPGLLIFLSTGFAVGMVFGMISARFRDIPQIVTSLLQVVFFVTPIIWSPEVLSSRGALVDWNPFFHFIEILRAPLLGNAPSALNWQVTIGVCICSWAMMLVFFRRFRSRITYWL